jgi:hypothetical protein
MSISSALATLGWVQAADTGQVDWDTIAAVPASNAYVYEIWRADDALAATCPIYIKMEYGTFGTGAGAGPRIRISVGTASSGAGALSGVSSGTYQHGVTVTPTGASLWDCYFSGNAGEFRMLMWRNCTTAGSPYAFIVERSKSAAGVDTDEYWSALMLIGNVPSGLYQITVMPSISAMRTESGGICCYSLASVTGLFNGTVFACPVFPIIGKLGNPMLGAACCLGADVGEGQVVTVETYGVFHDYIASKGTNSTFKYLGTTYTNATGALLMRWE